MASSSRKRAASSSSRKAASSSVKKDASSPSKQAADPFELLRGPYVNSLELRDPEMRADLGGKGIHDCLLGLNPSMVSLFLSSFSLFNLKGA
jgi:hypothetical protein